MYVFAERRVTDNSFDHRSAVYKIIFFFFFAFEIYCCKYLTSNNDWRNGRSFPIYSVGAGGERSKLQKLDLI